MVKRFHPKRPSPLGAASRARQVHFGAFYGFSVLRTFILLLELAMKLPSLRGEKATMPDRCVLWSRGLGMRGQTVQLSIFYT
jgi:hypothetical protein